MRTEDRLDKVEEQANRIYEVTCRAAVASAAVTSTANTSK